MIRNILEIPFITAELYPDRISHKIKNADKIEFKTYKEFARLIRELTAGFRTLGIEKDKHVGFFVNNRYEWIATDFALMALGAVSVPRGSDTFPKELKFIYEHSDSSFLIIEKIKQLEELESYFTEENWNSCSRIFIVESAPFETVNKKYHEKIVFYSDLINLGKKELENEPDLVEKKINETDMDNLFTIVYTSGTTGNPKGVMLTQRNFYQNVVANTPRLQIDPEKGEVTVVMLPSWHVYERAFEYCGILSGLTFVYSSAKRFAADLLEEKPEIIISVPRVWESIYQKLIKALSLMPFFKRHLVFGFIKINQIYLSSSLYLKGGYISLKKRSFLRKVFAYFYNLIRVIITFPGHLLAGKMFKPFRDKVGGALRGATCAAGSLPKYLDEIFNSIGITLVNAYGMTECAPGILSRTFELNTFGTTGYPFANTEVQVRRKDGSTAETGEKGVLFAKGPQVMMGYYKNPAATAAVLDENGWLNTGDLSIKTENGEFLIVGRDKDTIVLMGGENVEPEPIEDKIKESIYIDHAVVLGQDSKQLTAIVAINEEELMRLASELKISANILKTEGKYSIENDVVYEILMKEVNNLISKEQGFKPFEFISKILPVHNDFIIGKELTQTLKIKRAFIEEKYKDLITFLTPGTDKKKKE
ncbi:MAG: AMP-binding protein [Spirochaetia bacterium]|jgi:long-chain acyl-CoA synthetase|nr:AMP-binding protein [Spirochaetia bacterium]